VAATEDFLALAQSRGAKVLFEQQVQQAVQFCCTTPEKAVPDLSVLCGVNLAWLVHASLSAAEHGVAGYCSVRLRSEAEPGWDKSLWER
jgi:hypothetical protein